MSQKRKAIGFLIIASVLWSSGGLLIKLVKWNPPAIAGMRSAITALVLLIYLRRPNFHWSFAQVGGALAYTSTVILFVLANKLTTAANAILLQYSAPIYVAWRNDCVACSDGAGNFDGERQTCFCCQGMLLLCRRQKTFSDFSTACCE